MGRLEPGEFADYSGPSGALPFREAPVPIHDGGAAVYWGYSLEILCNIFHIFA